MSAEIRDHRHLDAHAVKQCTSQLYKIDTRLGKDKRHLAYWPFVAPQKVPAIKRVGTTKSNAFANSMASRRAKTVQQL